MEQYIGQDILNLQEREQFIKDNAEGVENMGYSKPLKDEVIDKLKEQLADSTIKCHELEEEKKATLKTYTSQIKELKTEIRDTADKLKSKSEYVNEACYKLVDMDERRTAYYNKEGMKVYERAARAYELQRNLFQMQIPKTGTND